LTSLIQKKLNLHEGDAQEHRRGPHHQDDQGAQEAFGQQGIYKISMLKKALLTKAIMKI
jgi:hypothetical protein